MASLSEARSKIFLLLGFLMGGQHLKRVLGLIGFGIHVSNFDIQSKYSQYRTMGPETMDKKITSVITGEGGGRRVREKRQKVHIDNKQQFEVASVISIWEHCGAVRQVVTAEVANVRSKGEAASTLATLQHSTVSSDSESCAKQ